MTTITITDIAAAAFAISWCDSTVPKDILWQVRAEFSNKTTYRFEFADDTYATLFALTWAS